MNDSQVKQQIQQLVSFIHQEAKDKAREIRAKAEEDFTIRKLSAVESAREKIRADYEKRTKQIEVNRKMFVLSNRQFSSHARQFPLTILKFHGIFEIVSLIV